MHTCKGAIGELKDTCMSYEEENTCMSMRTRIHAYIRGSHRGAEGRAATGRCGSESRGLGLVRVFLLSPEDHDLNEEEDTCMSMRRRIHACVFLLSPERIWFWV